MYLPVTRAHGNNLVAYMNDETSSFFFGHHTKNGGLDDDKSILPAIRCVSL